MGFFKAYDMRGTYGVDFDLELVFRIGKALPQVVTRDIRHPRWLIGRDCRVTGEAVRDALIRGLVAAGAEVTDLGLCTTPMVYYFTAEDGYDGSVMITASHNPPTDNGLKVSKRGALPVGYADGLDEVERLVQAEASVRGEPNVGESPAPSRDGDDRVHEDAIARYLAWQRSRTLEASPAISRLRFAVDCSNGMASLLAHELFSGAEIINDTPDGAFPCHSPNPLKAEAREQLAALVRAKGLDCGVIFDGDADRCMFVDERGEFVQPDYLTPVVARATLRQLANWRLGEWTNDSKGSQTIPKVVHDVRTSRGAIEELRRMGCEPVMVPVGHAFAKPVLRQRQAVCGGELAGHYYFGEFHGCDSGILAALRILSEIALARAAGKSFSEMMAPISGAYANSGEINFKVEDKDAAIRRVLATAASELPKELSRSEMDGLRIEYAEGWINVRKSNTEPYLRLIAECDTKERLAKWLASLTGAIENDR